MASHEAHAASQWRAASSPEPLYGQFAMLHPRELAAILERQPIAYIPSGTLEWHSQHLPVGLDGLLAEEVCLRAARLSGGVVVPTTYWAIGGVPHPFTIRIEPEIVEALFVSVLEQLAHVGFRAAIILAGHYGLDHHSALKRAALHAMTHGGMMVHALPEFELVTDLGFRGGDHAGAWETSILWALRPDLVDMSRLPHSGTLSGVQGEDPREGASEERGQRLVEPMVERLASLASRLVQASHAERSAQLEALTTQVAYLDDIRRERTAKPLSHAHPLLSEAYLRALDALWRGDYPPAMEALDAARISVLQANGRSQ